MEGGNPILRDRRRRALEIDGTAMKIFGCVAMLFYTCSLSVIQNGLIHITDYAPEELTAALETDPRLISLSSWAVLFQLIGGMGVPVFAFLLVEGFLHTSSYRKYILSIAVCAAVSEVPYDFCISGTVWTMESQNVMFTYFLCLVMLYGLRALEKNKNLWLALGQAALVIAVVLWASLLRCAFGLCTVLLVAIYYLLRKKKGMKIMLGCAVSFMYVTAPLSGYAIWKYNGQRGKLKNKYIFYALYPAHLLLFGLIARYLAR